VPVLCITGSLDERYTELAGRMVDRVGTGARHEVIDGAGHAAHLERPDAVVEVVTAFLDELQGT
jgi:2-succinyl-6-hydroxy-2,4-cyclohexadiene-1-carboxylate synthase